MGRSRVSGLIPLLLAGCAASQLAWAADHGQAKVAVPTAAAQRASRQRLDEAFPIDRGKTSTAAGKTDRARMLVAAATPDLPTVDRFVLLDTARRLAVEAGDVDGAMSCLAALAREFSLPVDAEAAKMLQAIAPKAGASQVPRLVEESIDLSARIRGAGDVPGAEKVCAHTTTTPCPDG